MAPVFPEIHFLFRGGSLKPPPFRIPFIIGPKVHTGTLCVGYLVIWLVDVTKYPARSNQRKRGSLYLIAHPGRENMAVVSAT